MSVVYEGVEYTAAEFAALGLSSAHYTVTADALRTGRIHAFPTVEQRDEFSAGVTARRADPSLRIGRENSNFFRADFFQDPVLQIPPGLSVRDLGELGLDGDIRSLKVSREVVRVTLWDGEGFTGESFDFTTGSEFPQLSVLRLSDGRSLATNVTSIDSDVP